MDELHELRCLRERVALQQRLDALLERAVMRRAQLEHTLAELLPLVREALGTRRAWVETLDEELVSRRFVDPPGEPVGARLERELDVAGERFGVIGVELAGAEDEARRASLGALLEVAAEELDDHLAQMRQARIKQRLLRGIHEALRQPLIHEGVRRAVEAIGEAVEFDLLVVLYHMQEDYENTLHYLVFRGRELEFRSGSRAAAALDEVLRGSPLTRPGGAPLIVRGAEYEHRRVRGEEVDLRDAEESQALLAALGYEECVENVLIAGLDDHAVVGKLVIASRRALGAWERDILHLFADVLQKRIVDYNQVAQLLHRSFSIPAVLRLLEEERPLERLRPRSAEISILFADVAGFTALSERCLREPARVSAFVDAWARGMTRILWEHGGVFDKLVGDCIIGLFGPPYFDQAPAERAAACVRAAVEMARFTREMIDHPACAPIQAAGIPLGVATGLNDAPASVGLFGPDQDYTCFSSGMNNTARLQGMARRDEILVMAPMQALLEAAGLGWRWSERREGRAKNVAEPLAFYALDPDSVR